MTDPATFHGRLTDVGARRGGSLVIETTVETARALAPLLYCDVEVSAAGTCDRLVQFANSLAASVKAQAERADTAGDRALLAEHQLATLARHVLDDDQVAARDYLAELGFGLTDGEEVLRGTAR